MNKDWIIVRDRFSREYVEGVVQFMAVAKLHVNELGKTRCPCKKCQNVMWQVLDVVEQHLFVNGISPTYSEWVHHGDSSRLDDYDVRDRTEANGDLNTEECNVTVEEDEVFEILNDLRVPIGEEDEDIEDLAYDMPTQGSERERLDEFDALMNEATKELYPGCTQLTSLHFLIKLMHIKVLNKWSNKSFDMLLQLLKVAFPSGANLASSFYEAKRKLRGLGLGYESIHACKYDCILFWKEFANLEYCPACGESRYKSCSGNNSKKIPHKVLRHFPLIPRLKRLFASKHVASEMRWHKDKRVETEGMLRHPADAAGWKHLDHEYPQFASDPRNVRLALASDGFNPSSSMNHSYSMWPVLLVPYNLPPWKCMKESYFFMTLLIPGPKSPRKDIDVYLQPLIDELQELWTNGVRTYDCASGNYFNMRAALLWTINDFPAYGDLSGWSTKGYQACPICNEDYQDKPICENATRFSNAIGSIVRENFDPVRYNKWKAVPNADVEKSIKRVLNWFDVNITQAAMKKFVYRRLQSTFKEYRAELHAYYKGKGPPEVARGMPHPRIMSIQDWHSLCDRWESPEWKELSRKSKESRSKVTYKHQAGSKSFNRLQKELKDKLGRDIGPVEMFKETRHDPTKGWVNTESEVAHKAMDDRMKAPVPEGTEPPTQASCVEDVMGPRSSFVVTMGLGPAPGTRRQRVSSNAQMVEELHETKEKLAATDEELRATREELRHTKERLNNNEAELRTTQARLKQNEEDLLDFRHAFESFTSQFSSGSRS